MNLIVIDVVLYTHSTVIHDLVQSGRTRSIAGDATVSVL